MTTALHSDSVRKQQFAPLLLRLPSVATVIICLAGDAFINSKVIKM